MVPLTLREAAQACAGTAENASLDSVVGGIAIDSRAVRPGDLFVALRGTRADGHAFVGDAIARGAVAVLVHAGAAVGEAATLRVADPGAALIAIAAAVRRGSSARVVGITGSSGKTSTKQLTAAAAGVRFRVAASAASYNNEIGVPLTVCTLDPDTQVLIAEVGSRGVGHIAALMPLLAP